MKRILTISILLLSTFINAQVGIGTTDPKALFDLTVSDPSAPTPNDGILVPRVSNFPGINPGIDQYGMLVFLTTNVGANTPGFYYWDNNMTSWVPVGVSSGFTVDKIVDTDGDTKIQVEESADEDIIRFDLAGTERASLAAITSDMDIEGGYNQPNAQFTLSNTGLVIKTEGTANTSQIISLQGQFPGSNFPYARFDMRNNDSGTLYTGASIRSFNDNIVNDGDLRFYTADNTTLSEKMRITSTGNVGIGTTTVTEKLNVKMSNAQSYFPNWLGSSGTIVTQVYKGDAANPQTRYEENGTSGFYDMGLNASGHYVIEDNDTEKFSINNGAIRFNNTYTFPTTDGTNGQMLSTNGSGVISWETPSISSMMDADGDTGIELIETATNDSISFKTNNVVVFAIKEGGIYTGFGGDNLFIGKNSGDNADNTGVRDNIGIGRKSLTSLTSGANNTAIGRESLSSITTGRNNTSIGSGSAKEGIATGDSNTAIGVLALAYAGSANQNNTAVGHQTLHNAFGNDNTAIGKNAGYSLYSPGAGDANVFVGANAGEENTGNGNVFIGYGTGTTNSSYLTASETLIIDNGYPTPLIYGKFDTKLFQVNGTLNINNAYSLPTTDGILGQVLQTDGSGNLSWAEKSILQDTDTDTKIQVEESVDEDVIRFDLAGTEYFTFKGAHINVLNSGESVFLGNNAGLSTTTGYANVFIGEQAGRSLTTNFSNVFIGSSAGRNATSSNNIFIGRYAGYDTDGDSNVAIGSFAMNAATSTALNNTVVGYNGLNRITSGVGNNVLGYGGLGNLTSGSGNTAIGLNSGANKTGGSNNIFIGNSAGQNNGTGGNNVFIGNQVGSNETGSNLLYIDNSNTVTPLLYGNFSTNILRVGGQLQIGSSDNTTTGSVYTLPITDGTANQVLTTDGSGTVSWSTPTITALSETGNDPVPSGVDVQTVVINFTSAFATAPKLQVTVHSASFGEIYVANVKVVNTTQAMIQVYRVDTPAGLVGTDVSINWLATEN